MKGDLTFKMVNVTNKLKKYLEKIRREDKKINAFLQINPNVLAEAKAIDSKIARSSAYPKLRSKGAGKLAGKIIAVKSNINVKGLNASCASITLKDYIAPYDATVIEKIKAEDGLIIGMTNMDEFAAGSSGETSAFGPVKNPQDLSLIPGGSSSGSAAAVSAGFCDMALGSDTGGSIRNPASHCGVVGLKPTYSSVSRYGLIDLSMSLDQIGCFAKSVEDVKLLFNVIKGKDENDSISQEGKDFSKSLLLSRPQTAQLRASRSSINNKLSSPKFTLGVLDLSGIKIDSKIQKLVDERVEQVAKENKWEIKKIKINYLDLAIETYYPLLYVEFFSATRRFDGRRYGKKIEDVAGPEVLRRILGGSEISKAEYGGRYYHQALKAKKLISEEFEKAFKNVDCIVLPTVPKLPHKIGEKISVKEMYSYDVSTVPANLAGNCAVSIPVGKIDGIPVGMQVMCDRFQDEKMLNVAGKFERI